VKAPKQDQRYTNFLSGGGEMGARIRSFDWSTSPLGSPENWPQSLLSAISILLSSRAQIILFWGPDLVALYNDAYAPVFGSKHPWALGKPARECWAEIWEDTLGPLFLGVLRSGEAFYAQDHPFLIERHGYLEETYFDVSYDPVRAEDGAAGGILCIVCETTSRVLERRRLQTLRALSASSFLEPKDDKQACNAISDTLGAGNPDVPFALIYLVDSDGKTAGLEATAGIAIGQPNSPLEIPLPTATAGTVWPLDLVLSSGRPELIDATRIPDLPTGAWKEPPRSCLILPIAAPGQSLPIGLLVAAVSPRRPLDEPYQNFYHTIAGHISTALANARAYEAERKRADALAEIDRAKTIFFSNVSHEFRTPLTLMLGPVDDALSTDLEPALREELKVVRRNGIRLLKLVNTLLDFSRIEAGRIRAIYEPIDLGTYTAELASQFRSATERAGLELVVDSPSLPEPVYVDREMWEKIVLNLISNALKFTFEGAITVSFYPADNNVELQVRDTGTGIAEAELPHIFERFHRITGARARTQEGAGIGLALVAELTRCHGGKVSVQSEVGKGTAFEVSIPKGSAHLPADRISAERSGPHDNATLEAFAAEADSWIVAEPDQERSAFEFAEPDRTPAPDSDFSARILLADDNADMREYISHILSNRWQVDAYADGRAALDAARENIPDLVLSDVMMPNLNGFELLRELRSQASTRDVPVVLLSARADEESRFQGLLAGADDYLFKPFTARELTARIQAHLKLARLRREATLEVEAARRRNEEILSSISDAFVVYDLEFRFTYVNDRALTFFGKTREELLGRCLWDIYPGWIGTDSYAKLQSAMTERLAVHFESFDETSGRWYESHVYPSDEGLTDIFEDISERKQAEAALLASERQLRLVTDNIPVFIVYCDPDLRYRFVNHPYAERFGRRPEDILGKRIPDVLGDEAYSAFGEYVDKCLAGQTVVFEVGIPYSGIGLHYMNCAYVPDLAPDGSVRGFYGLISDVTERKRAEEEIARLLAEEQTARTQAEEASRFKDEFLATVSHELRTPLNSMLGWLHLLRLGTLDDESSRSAIEIVHRNAQAQIQLIEDILDVSRIITGKLRLDLRQVDLTSVIRAALDTVRPAAEAKNIQIMATFPALSTTVRGDPNRLQQVAWNLLSNAVKFTPMNGRVVVTMQHADAMVHMSVSDTGQGIDPEFLPHVFERFRQGDASTRRTHTGLGLGLAIVRHLVELHGGSVNADSGGQGQGATFTVALPVAAAAAVREPATSRLLQHTAAEQSPAFGQSLTGLRVLAVDDEPDAREMLAKLLKQLGAEIRTCGSAAETLAVLSEWSADVLLADIGMPVQDGYDLIRQVRALPADRGGNVPAVALTAYARPEDQARALAAGFQVHLPKPVDPNVLATVVARAARRQLG
jgi:PAS domain S-box-containing protein